MSAFASGGACAASKRQSASVGNWGLGDSVFKSGMMRARRIKMLCAAAMSVAISGEAIGQEQQLQQQPPQQQQQAPQSQQPQSPPPPTPSQHQSQTQLPGITVQSSKPKSKVTAHTTTRQRAPRPIVTRQPPPPVPPPASTAISANLSSEATEAAGYKPSTVSNLGPFGPTPIQDVPYSVSVISRPLIENQQASIADDIYKIDPLIQQATTTTHSISPNPILRGFLVSNSSGRGEDGMIEQTLFGVPLEDKERVEVYTGLTNFLYGATNVGGFINYVLKRPTLTPYASVTGGDYGGAEGYVHGDFGGPITQDGTLAYRLNILEQGGHDTIVQEGMQRDLVSAAMTWNITSDAALTVLASHYYQYESAIEAAWSVPTNADGSVKFPWPAAPNASQYYGQPWTSQQLERDRGGGDFKWQINDLFTVRASYAYTSAEVSNNISPTASFTNSSGAYTETVTKFPNFYYTGNSGYTFVDTHFFLANVENKITTGYYANNYWFGEPPTTFAGTTYTGLNVNSPAYFSEPAFTPSGAAGPVHASTQNSAQNIVIGDDIKFTSWLGALVGGNYTMLAGQNYNTTTGFQTSAYEQARMSPAVSLIYKPISQVSIYGTYSQSLQPGQVVQNAGSTIYTNNGTSLPPFVGTQYEIGAKATVGGLLLTAAVFQITQALQYAQYNNNNTYTYVQNGQQRNRGIELTATGNVFTGFRVLTGLTLIDPRITESASSSTNPSLDGLEPIGVASVLAKMTAEYDVPLFKGFTLTGGVYYTGRQAVDTRNTDWIPAFVTEDLGFRYRLTDWYGEKLPYGREWIFRFQVANIANADYWLSPYGYVGQPRTFLASAQVKF
jgi:iron complex outermembrane recepter protein